jgi:hypothetical protein
MIVPSCLRQTIGKVIRMKIAPLVLFFAAFLVAASFSTAKEPAEPVPETKVVLRVSRHFIHRLIGVGFKHGEPIDSTARGVMTRGNALAEGTIDVKLHESATESKFDLLVQGEILTQIASTRRPVQVCAHGVAPFRAARRIAFDGAMFTAEPLSIEVRNHFSLDEIRKARGGPAGPLARGLARPFVRRGLADGDRQAEDQIRTQVSQSLGEQTDKLLGALNKVKPLIEQGEKLLIEQKLLSAEGLHYYRAATKEHVYLSVGRPDHRIPTLPTLDESQRAPIELWIAKRKDGREELALLFLTHWRDFQPLFAEQLRQRSPDLAKELDGKLEQYLKDVRVVEADGWHVVTFAPKLHPHLVVDIP